MTTMSLVDKIVAVHTALEDHDVPHAFGGALALAWCTGAARGTIDIDLNVFLDVSSAAEVLDALPNGVRWSDSDLAAISTYGQVRLWWDATPVDLFMNTTTFHADVRNRCSVESFAGAQIPFLGCSDLAVFKAFFNRTKDWADIEEMIAAGTIDHERVIGILSVYLGNDDERVSRLISLI